MSTPTVDVIEDFDVLTAAMDSYCEGVEFDGELPASRVDPDPNPPGESVLKDDIHSVETYFKV